MNEANAAAETGPTRKAIAPTVVAVTALLSVVTLGIASNARADDGADRSRGTQVQGEEDHNCPDRDDRSEEVDA